MFLYTLATKLHTSITFLTLHTWYTRGLVYFQFKKR